MDKIKKLLRACALISVFSCLFISIGYSDWLVFLDNQYSSNNIMKKVDEPVAYIGSGDNKKYYLTIGKAIETAASGDTVTVIPPSVVEREDPRYCISPSKGENTLTIPFGVTLNIPYADGATNNKKPTDGGSGEHTLGNQSFLKLSTWIKDGVTLKNEGTIEIGGVLGSFGGGRPTGGTSGNYAELCLGAGSKLESSGTINVYGLLGETSKGKGNCEVVFQQKKDSNEKAKLNLPFYWFDFPGGSTLKAVYDKIDNNQCLPLDDFYLENVTPKTTFKYGSAITAWVNINAADQYAEYDMTILDSNNNSGIISISDSDSYLISNYNESTLVSNLDFYGNFQLNEFKIDIKKAITDTAGKLAWLAAEALGIPSSVTSSDGYFPISYHWQVSMNKLKGQSNCTVDGSGNRYKMLNGSGLKINSGALLKTSALVAYRGEDYLSGREGLAGNLKKSKTVTKPAEIIVNGSVSGNIVAADIKTSFAGARVETTQSTSTILFEPKNGSGNSLTAKMTDWYEIPTKLTLSHLEHYAGSQFSDEDVASTGSYLSEEREEKFGFITNKTYFDIAYHNSYEAVSSDSDFDENQIAWENKVTSFNVETSKVSFSKPEYQSGDYYLDDEQGIFFFDAACTKQIPSDVNASELRQYINSVDKKIHIYLKWIENVKDEFQISYEYSSANGNHDIVSINAETVTGKKNDTYKVKSFDDCKDYEVIKTANVSKTGYQFIGYSINGSTDLIQPGDISISKLRELVPEGNELKLVAKYKETKYLWMKINNVVNYKGIGTYYVIQSLTLNGDSILDKGGWIKPSDSVYVKVDWARSIGAKPKCTIKIGGTLIETIGSNSSKTIQFENYSALFDKGTDAISVESSK